jgi:saccharopine dehydrogenase-like NADP-dependent oxidoreductase
MRVAVLGAGRVGGTIARDLATDGEFEVTLADRSAGALSRHQAADHLSTVHADLAQDGVVDSVVTDHDLVVGALPGFLGFATLRRVLEADKDVVDISFLEEDPFLLDELARERERIAIVDCGIAPGCSNLILGRLDAVLDSTESFECLVGGLPVIRTWPYEYKAPFSPLDVIEEYTRPARLRRGGRTVTLPALSGVELVDFPGVGTLEAFNTDGLRTLLRTVDTPDMSEKTMRYPGHAERMRVLREGGFFGKEPLDVGGTSVRPIDVTARLLQDSWRFEEGEEDLTAMRVVVEGNRGGKAVRHTFELLDRYDPETRTQSMARTTGYTCTAAVRLLAQGLYGHTGVSPLELVGREKVCFEFILSELGLRGVRFDRRVEEG